MLRITIALTPVAATVKLEGKLLAPWLSDLRRAVRRARRPGCMLRLDLADVTFVDSAGIGALERMLRGGAVLAACSSFVAELLQVSEP